MEIEEALSILENAVTPVEEKEDCQLSDAYGRIAAVDIFAPINVPPFAKSAMDGYAVRAADVAGASEDAPVQLKVRGQLFAGDWIEGPVVDAAACSDGLPPAVRVMTGSPLPAGFDSVVMQEDTDYGEDTVLIYKSVRPGQNYCPVGEDIKKESLVLKAGSKIGRIHIGLLASLGIEKIQVRRKIRTAIISTGSELTEAGKPLAPGKIYSSIAPMLSSSINNSAVTKVIENQIVSDNEEEIAGAIKNAVSQADIIITTGGVSVGKKDLLPLVLESLGVKKLFSQVNIKPGTPTRAGLLDGKLILSLSGNPYAALVNFDLYFYQAISLLTGCKELSLQKKEALLINPYEKISGRRCLLRACYEDGNVSIQLQNNKSSVISSMVDCNCYLDLPAGTSVKKGDRLQVWMTGK